MISIDDLEGKLEVTVQRGPARMEDESDEEYMARVGATETEGSPAFTLIKQEDD